VLLHTPVHGNGTSVVVSDALSCGKLAILSPLPAYREAYGDLDGVLFTDQPREELVERICAYSPADFPAHQCRIRGAPRSRRHVAPVERGTARWRDPRNARPRRTDRGPRRGNNRSYYTARPRHPWIEQPINARRPVTERALPLRKWQTLQALLRGRCTVLARRSASNADPSATGAEQINLLLARAVESYKRTAFDLAASCCDEVLASDAAAPHSSGWPRPRWAALPPRN
jgi:hypothetical protein